MGADGCGECTNKNACVVKTTLERGLVLSFYKSDEHGRALAEAYVGPTTEVSTPGATPKISTHHVPATGRGYSEKSGRRQLLCRRFIPILLQDRCVMYMFLQSLAPLLFRTCKAGVYFKYVLRSYAFQYVF